MNAPFNYKLFGLEPRDLIVYEAMLASSEACSIRTIAAKVDMNRGTTFEIIKKLVAHGMVAGYHKGTRKYYRAEPPTSLKKFAAERQTAMREALQEVTEYVGQLEALQPHEMPQPFGRHYEGEEEIAVLLRDVLTTVAESEDKAYRVISSAQVRNHMYAKFRNFTRQRIKQGISVRVLCVGSMGSDAELAERKLLTKKEFPASYIIIYGDKVAQLTLTNLGEIQGSVVENVGVTSLQRLLFDTLWDKLNP